MALKFNRIGVGATGHDPYEFNVFFCLSRKNAGKVATAEHIGGVPGRKVYYGTPEAFSEVYEAPVGWQIANILYASDSLILFVEHPDNYYARRLVEIRGTTVVRYESTTGYTNVHLWTDGGGDMAVSADESTISWVEYQDTPAHPRRVYISVNGTLHTVDLPADIVYVYGPGAMAPDGSWVIVGGQRAGYNNRLFKVTTSGYTEFGLPPGFVGPITTFDVCGGPSGKIYAHCYQPSPNLTGNFRVFPDGTYGTDALTAMSNLPVYFCLDGSVTYNGSDMIDAETGDIINIPEPYPGFYAKGGYAYPADASGDGRYIWGYFDYYDSAYPYEDLNETLVFRFDRQTSALEVTGPMSSNWWPEIASFDGSVIWCTYPPNPNWLTYQAEDYWPATWQQTFEDSFVGSGPVEAHTNGAVSYSVPSGEEGVIVLTANGLDVVGGEMNNHSASCSLEIVGDWFVEIDFVSNVENWSFEIAFGMPAGMFDWWNSNRAFTFEAAHNGSYPESSVGQDNNWAVDMWGPFHWSNLVVGLNTARIERVGPELRLYCNGTHLHTTGHRMLDTSPHMVIVPFSEGDYNILGFRVGEPVYGPPPTPPDFWQDLHAAKEIV